MRVFVFWGEWRSRILSFPIGNSIHRAALQAAVERKQKPSVRSTRNDGSKARTRESRFAEDAQDEKEEDGADDVDDAEDAGFPAFGGVAAETELAGEDTLDAIQDEQGWNSIKDEIAEP